MTSDVMFSDKFVMFDFRTKIS